MPLQKILDVPLHLQAKGSEDCGPTGTLMVLDYYGITSDAQEVIAKVPRCNFGTSSFDNAKVLLDYGLKVEMIMAQPNIFDGDFIRSKPSNEQIIARITEVRAKEEDAERLAILTSLIIFIEAGGKLTLQIVTQETIRQALDANKPVWISMYTRTLGQDQGGYHTVVIGGYKNNKFLVFNPWPLSRQKSWENASELLFGIHASTLFDYDNGTILIASK